MHAFLFETDGIQAYILASGKLRDIVGGSELLERLWSTTLDAVIESVDAGQPKQIEFSRRAGGALYAFCAEQAHLQHFIRLWTLVVRQWAPELGFTCATGSGDNAAEAFHDARAAMAEAKNHRPTPDHEAGPFVARYARTGAPAVDHVQRAGGREAIDAPATRFESMLGCTGLAERFAGTTLAHDYHWPVNLDPEADGDTAFPFLRDNRYVGIIHADGNGLGQLLQAVFNRLTARPAGFIAVFRALSGAIEHAASAASIHASNDVLKPAARDKVMPARPILLGGDDLTAIVRGDLAIDFAQAFLAGFERESEIALARVCEQYDIPEFQRPLTACAGIAFVRSNQPFQMSATLAEQLCRSAKIQAQRKDCAADTTASAIAFHRASTSLIADYQNAIADEMTAYENDTGHAFCSTLGAYAIHDDTVSLPLLSDLKALDALLGTDDMATGPSRRLLGLIHTQPADARTLYGRWQRAMEKEKPHRAAEFNNLLHRLVGETLPDLPYSQTAIDHQHVGPLGDILALKSASRAPDQQQGTLS